MLAFHAIEQVGGEAFSNAPFRVHVEFTGYVTRCGAWKKPVSVVPRALDFVFGLVPTTGNGLQFPLVRSDILLDRFLFLGAQRLSYPIIHGVGQPRMGWVILPVERIHSLVVGICCRFVENARIHAEGRHKKDAVGHMAHTGEHLVIAIRRDELLASWLIKAENRRSSATGYITRRCVAAPARTIR